MAPMASNIKRKRPHRCGLGVGLCCSSSDTKSDMNHGQSVDAQKHRKESAIFCDADYEAQIITFAAHLCHCGFDRVLAGFVRFRGLKVYVHDRALNQACAASRDAWGPPIGVWCGPRTTNHAPRSLLKTIFISVPSTLAARHPTLHISVH